MSEMYGYNPKNKNGRWPFPTLHVFRGISSRSSCGKVDKRNLVVSSEVPKEILYTVCELCVYGQPNLREKLYG